MKKMNREVTISKPYFVSVDGKEFENEADCLAWEKSYNGTLAASWELIPKVKASSCALGLYWSDEDHECYIIRPKDLDEVTVMNAYIASSTYKDGVCLTAKHIGKLVVLNFGYDHDSCDVYIAEDHIQRIAEYVAQMEGELSNKEAK